MKLQHLWLILPLAATSFTATAEQATTAHRTEGSTFHFSTQVQRTVEKDLMQAEVYSRKSGKQLSALKKGVSSSLNKVLAYAKTLPALEISAEGINNYADYDQKGKVIGWVAEGSITLKSKDFDAIANVLENLGDDVAIRYIDFSLSPEKIAALEDEMTLEVIEKFQHKANVIQKALKAEKYVLSSVNLTTPNGHYQPPMAQARAFSAAKSAEMTAIEIPLEAGKATISANASGKVIFE